MNKRVLNIVIVFVLICEIIHFFSTPISTELYLTYSKQLMTSPNTTKLYSTNSKINAWTHVKAQLFYN